MARIIQGFVLGIRRTSPTSVTIC